MADAAEQYRNLVGLEKGHIDVPNEAVEVAPTGQAEVVEADDKPAKKKKD